MLCFTLSKEDRVVISDGAGGHIVLEVCGTGKQMRLSIDAPRHMIIDRYHRKHAYKSSREVRQEKEARVASTLQQGVV